jgi:hypothetical protein
MSRNARSSGRPVERGFVDTIKHSRQKSGQDFLSGQNARLMGIWADERSKRDKETLPLLA